MQNSFHIQLQQNGKYALTLIGSYSSVVWATKLFDLEIFEVQQMLGWD